MYKSELYKMYNLHYCSEGLQESNEKNFFRHIRNLKSKRLYYLNSIFENISIFFIKFFYRRKRVARYAEIIPVILNKRRRIKKTINFLVKHWPLFSTDIYKLRNQKKLLYKTIYKNRLNFGRWKPKLKRI